MREKKNQGAALEKVSSLTLYICITTLTRLKWRIKTVTYRDHLADISIISGQIRKLNGASAGRVVIHKPKRVETRGFLIFASTTTTAFTFFSSLGYNSCYCSLFLTTATSPETVAFVVAGGVAFGGGGDWESDRRTGWREESPRSH